MRYPYTIVHLYILIPSYSPRIHGNTLDTAPGIEWIQEGNEGLSVRGRWQLPIARHHANRRPPEMCPGKGLEMQWLNWGIYVALKFKWSKEVGKQNFRVTDDWNSNNNTTQYMRNNTQVTLGSGDWGKLRSFWRVIGSCRVCVRSCRVVAIPQLKITLKSRTSFFGAESACPNKSPQKSPQSRHRRSHHSEFCADEWSKPETSVPVLNHGPEPWKSTARARTCQDINARKNAAPTRPLGQHCARQHTLNILEHRDTNGRYFRRSQWMVY